MSADPTILGLVKRDAKRKIPPARLASLATSPRGEWAEVESALLPMILADPGRAERLVRSFERVAEASGSREGGARAARLHGSWLSYVGRFEESVAPYEVAVTLLSGAPRDGARLGIAGSLLRLGRFEEAIRLCRRIRSAAKRRGDVAILGGADLNEAVAFHESGRPERSLELYERARSAFEESGHAGMAATALQNTANALVLLDRYEEAAPRYDDAARVFDAAGAANEAARCRYNRGALLVATDRLGAADQVLFAEEQVFRRLGDRVHAALCRLDRGEALFKAGLVPEARLALSTARRRLARGAPPVEQARCALLLARAHLAAGDATAARRLLARPLALSGAVEGDREEILGLAAGSAERLLGAARAHGRRRPVAAIRARLAAAACAFDAGEAGSARRILGGVRPRLAAFPLPGLRFAESALTFLVEDKAGRRDRAEVALERSIRDLSDVRAGLGSDAFRAALLGGRERWLARAVRHRLAEGEDRALDFLDQWRARALGDLLGEADRVLPRDQRLARLHGRVAALERRLEGGLAPGFLRSPEPGEGAALLRRLLDAEEELAAATRLDPAEAAIVTPEVVRHRLPAGTLVLSLFSDGDGTLLFTTDRSGTEVRSLPTTRTDVAKLTDELHFVLGQFTIGGDFVRRHHARLERRTARILSEIARSVLAPVEDSVRRAGHVVVVPHGEWHRVPFPALPVGGRPLVSNRSLTLAPSLGSLHHPPRAARGRPVVLAFADEAAPHITGEGRDVAAVLPRAELFEDADATLSRLLNRAPPSCLHIAAHGSYRADAPSMSGVRLADGWLRSVDLPSLPLRGSTIVLSGCQTGVTNAGAGEEVQGLVRGALAAGCSDLVASLWRVDDKSTALLFRRFHRERIRTGSAASALATAQRSMAREGLHPFYWAGFTVWSRRPDAGD